MATPEGMAQICALDLILERNIVAEVVCRCRGSRLLSLRCDILSLAGREKLDIYDPNTDLRSILTLAVHPALLLELPMDRDALTLEQVLRQSSYPTAE